MADCTITKEVKEAYKKLKFNKADNQNAMILKIKQDSMEVVLDEYYTDTSIAEVQQDLEESTPRFIIYSYRWTLPDGRKQYPIVFIYYSPEGSPPAQNMLYSRMKGHIENEFQIQRAFELRDMEEFEEEWLLALLKKK